MAITQGPYIDPISGSDGTGTGAIGAPYATTQYALDHYSRDGSNGNVVHIVNGLDVLSAGINTATWGVPSENVPTIFLGESGGGWDGNDGDFTLWNGNARQHFYFVGMEFTNSGTAPLITKVNQHGLISGCYLHTTDSDGVQDCYQGGVVIEGSRFEDIGGYGIILNENGCGVSGNYFLNAGSHSFTAAIKMTSNPAVVSGNIISVSGASIGIDVANYYQRIFNNSIFSVSGTGSGIAGTTSYFQYGGEIKNNLIEGFSGAGGKGIAFGTIINLVNNAVYNCTTAYSTALIFNPGDGNETLGASPFAKSGANTFANRFVYFAPVDTGNVLSGYPVGSYLAKGAVQSAPAAPGGGGLLTPNPMRGNVV